MIEDYRDSERKKVARVKAVMHIIMGIVFAAIGIYFLVYDKIGINVFRQRPSVIDYFIGGLFLLYGFFRIYRGFKKDNSNEG
jgi:hypothetical protein